MSRFGFVEYPLGLSTRFGTFATPGIHRMMLQDRGRLQPLVGAIQRTVTQDMPVIEVGGGSGVLALAAAQNGGRVVTLEASGLAPVIEAAAQTNGLADRVESIQCMSFDYQAPGTALAQLLISETLGHVGVDEGILGVMADARERLLMPDALMLPSSLSLWAQPVFCPGFTRDVVGGWHQPYAGFDLSAMVPLCTSWPYLTGPAAFEVLAPRQSSDVLTLGLRHEKVTVSFEFAVGKGRVTGFALGFSAALGDTGTLNSWDTESWHPVFLPLPREVQVSRGARVEFSLCIQEKDARWWGVLDGTQGRESFDTQQPSQ